MPPSGYDPDDKNAKARAQRKELPQNSVFGLPEFVAPLILFILGVATRFWRLREPPAVVFDEFHFGNFVQKYMRGKYLFDIHPPLGKLTLLFAGWLVGYDAEKCGYDHIHYKYGPDCKFMPLRVAAASFGCATVPFIYSVARRLGCSVWASILVTTFFLLDNLNLIESRLILVDSQLIFYSVLSLWIGLCYFQRRREHEDAKLLQLTEVRQKKLQAEVSSAVNKDGGRNSGSAQLASAMADRVVVPLLSKYDLVFDEYDNERCKGLSQAGYGSLGWRATCTFKNPLAASETKVASEIVDNAGSTAPLRTMSFWERMRWAVVLGLACGCAVSIKWTALATPGMIALECAFGLYFLREAVALLDLLVMGMSAIAIYTYWFWWHFKLLPLSGDGDGFMRIEFQRNLEGNQYYDANAPKQGFLTSFWQLNNEMLSANARIDTPHHWMSKWWSWPLNLRGLLYFSEDVDRVKKTQRLVYLLGNPAVIWLILVGVCVAFGFAFVYCRYRHDSELRLPRSWGATMRIVTYLCLVYLCNLLPYILVSRSAFIYHYMPALLYGELIFGVLVDRLCNQFAPRVTKYLTLGVLLVWLHFAPWVYCLEASHDDHARRRWLKGWD